MTWIDDVLAFWFDTLAPADWWRADPGLDARIRERYGELHRRMAASPPDVVALDARGHVAAVVVLDQFSRHLHRGSAAAYANDAAALTIACDALDRGLDAALPPVQRHFLCMPLMHSEDLETQGRSLAVFDALGDPGASRSAHEHHDTIARFGRFPARNAALGRTSTEAEATELRRRTRRSRKAGDRTISSGPATPSAR